jgi:hypothetical protein
MGKALTTMALFQQRDLAPQPPFGQRRQRGRVRLALDQGRQDRPSRPPHDVRRDSGPLDIGPLQHALHPIDLPPAFRPQLAPVTRQIPQIALPLGRAVEVQRLLALNPPRDIQRALYWRRWSSSARAVPEAFLFIWMALERLAGAEARNGLTSPGSPVRQIAKTSTGLWD